MRADRLRGLRRIPPAVRRVQPRMVLYHSWWGRLADNPKAIFEELCRRDAPLEHVWVLRDPAAAPYGSTAVRPGSARFLEALGRARYVVSNTTLPGYFRKKAGTTYLQTWHGTPLKRIGWDIERPRFDGAERFFKDLRREVASWDFLVSPNPFSTQALRNGLHYDGEIIESGYPRNDLLLAEDRAAVRARVRSELGIPDNACAVLYAPTWRDDSEFATALDLAALARTLGERYVVLLRAHSAIARTVSLLDGPGLRNVSGRDDVGDLLLAADVLVTDYSSVMFDFAATGKPMVFFTYDLEHYRDEVRGFYFDFAAEAPGPLIDTTAGLVEALRSLDRVNERFAPAYERFAERFCQLEDGRASQRVVDAVFGP